MHLIFVYNANSGKLNTLFDIAHKIIQPSSYACDLCSLTHGALSEKQAWKDFRDRTALSIDFLHKDEFEKQYNTSYDYPVILKHADELNLFMSAEDIGVVSDVEDLISRIEKQAEQLTEATND